MSVVYVSLDRHPCEELLCNNGRSVAEDPEGKSRKILDIRTRVAVGMRLCISSSYTLVTARWAAKRISFVRLLTSAAPLKDCLMYFSIVAKLEPPDSASSRRLLTST